MRSTQHNGVLQRFRWGAYVWKYLFSPLAERLYVVLVRVIGHHRAVENQHSSYRGFTIDVIKGFRPRDLVRVPFASFRRRKHRCNVASLRRQDHHHAVADRNRYGASVDRTSARAAEEHHVPPADHSKNRANRVKVIEVSRFL